MIKNMQKIGANHAFTVTFQSIAYGVLSIAMVFINKYILSSLNTPPELLIIVQSLISVACLFMFRMIHKFPFTMSLKSDYLICFSVNVAFVITILANSFALKNLSVHMVTLLKCCTVVFTAFLDHFFLKHNFTPLMWMSLLLIVIGSLLGIITDQNKLIDTPKSMTGYIWMGISIVCMSVYAILSKVLISNQNIHYFTASFWNNAMCLILLPSVLKIKSRFFTDELQNGTRILDHVNKTSDEWKISVIVILSGLLSLMLNLSMYNLIGLTSATSYVVVSAGKKIVQAGLSFIIYGTSTSNGISIMMGLMGASSYAILKWDEQQTIEEAKKKAENECLLSSDSSEIHSEQIDLYPLDPIE